MSKIVSFLKFIINRLIIAILLPPALFYGASVFGSLYGYPQVRLILDSVGYYNAAMFNTSGLILFGVLSAVTFLIGTVFFRPKKVLVGQSGSHIVPVVKPQAAKDIEPETDKSENASK